MKTFPAFSMADFNPPITGIGYNPEGQILQDEQPVDFNKASALRQCIRAGLLCNDSHLEIKNVSG